MPGPPQTQALRLSQAPAKAHAAARPTAREHRLSRSHTAARAGDHS
jgi:hypothetical protein